MGVHADAYGTLARVEALVGELVSNKRFTTATVPTKAEVEDVISVTGHEINNWLESFGYTSPISQADDETAYLIAKSANEAEAALRVLNMTPAFGRTGFDDEDMEVGGRARNWHNQFNRFMLLIKDGTLSSTRSRTRFSYIRSGAEYNRDGSTKLPMFTRDKFAHPDTPLYGESETS